MDSVWWPASKETLAEQQYHFVIHNSNKDCFIIDSLNRLWSRPWIISLSSRGFHRKHMVFLENKEIDTKIYVDSKLMLSWGFNLTECMDILNISIFKITWAYSLSTNFSNFSCIYILLSSLFLAICPLLTKIQALLVLLL